MNRRKKTDRKVGFFIAQSLITSMRRRLQQPERKQPGQQRRLPVRMQPERQEQQRQQPVRKQPERQEQQQELQQPERKQQEQEQLLLFCRKQPEQQPTGKRSTVFFS